MPRTPQHEAARIYASRGWFVFPIEPPRQDDPKSGKAPIGSLVPRGKDDATVDVNLIDRWWSLVPNANVGIACEPSKLIVLDVDVGKNKAGATSLAALEQEIGQLIPTSTVITGGGGLHAYYIADSTIPGVQKIGFRPGLDLINKGYVVAPPSLHVTGRAYAWNDVREPVLVPRVLIDAANVRKSPADLIPTTTSADEAIPEGRRNDALFKFGCAIRDTGAGEKALASAMHFENQRRFQPPLPDEEVMRLVSSVMRRVTPSRDVVLGSVIAAQAEELMPAPPQPGRAAWIRDVGARDETPMRFYSTGFPQLDSLMGGGLATRQLCGVIGPPSAGKSAFVGSIVDFVQNEVPVLHVSTELPRFELFVRYAALRMGFPWREGMKGLISRIDMQAAIMNSNVKLIGCDDLDMNDPLGSIAREAVVLANERGEMPGIVIDYVQLLSRGSEDNMREKVGATSMHIRKMCQALDTWIMPVFSTKRDFYGGGKLELLRESDDPTVYLAAAKESGDIEFDCATILFLDVEKQHEGQPKPARIAVARCRVGDIGFVGARAKLDVGKWWADPAATMEMNQDEKRMRKSLDRVSQDALRIFDYVQRMPGRSWRDIRGASGLGSDRADAARAKLIEIGRIEYADEQYFDALQRPQKRTVIRAIGNSPLDLGATETGEKK